MSPYRMLFLASLALLAPACGTTPGSSTDGSESRADASMLAPDLAVAADLAASPSPDLTPGCSTALLLGPQFKTNTAECKSCATTNCCGELSACTADAACTALRTCFAACAGPNDTACAPACIAKLGSNGASSAVSTCRNSKCGADCSDFSCVGKVTWPAPAKQTYNLTLHLLDYLSGAVIPSAAVKVCGNADVSCAKPLATLMSDAKGTIALTVPSAPGSVGAFLEITVAGYPVYLDYLIFAPGVSIDGIDRNLSLVSTNTLGLLSGAAQQQQDMAKGMLIFTTYQCVDFAAPGIIVRGDSGTTVYVAGTLPSPAATTTDASGRGAIFNVTPGMATVTTTLGGKPYGTQKILTRAGVITLGNLVPTP